MTTADINLIFVIDDDDAFRRSLVFLLEDLDWRVEAFASAAEFWRLIQNQSRRQVAFCLMLYADDERYGVTA